MACEYAGLNLQDDDLLDEPTAALDAETESVLVAAIEEKMRERTVILVAHRLSTIRNADRILVLKHGKAVEVGSHSELLEKQGAYSRLWKAQTEIDASTRSGRVR